jgi:hypothetical protein
LNLKIAETFGKHRSGAAKAFDNASSSYFRFSLGRRESSIQENALLPQGRRFQGGNTKEAIGS